MKGEKLWKQILETDEGGNPVLAKIPIYGISRRSFLAALGYTAAGLTLMSCRVPEQKYIPNLTNAPEQTPGIANWHASTCSGCSAGCGTLVKVREGRPIKLEGNPDHPISKGGLCAIAHSLVFSLFDSERLKQPLIGGKEADWKDVDSQIIAKLNSVKQSGGKVRFLSNTIIGPTSQTLIDRFLSSYEGSSHIVYEPVSTSAISAAHLKTLGVETIPIFKIDKAKLLVSFDADFLGTWISPVRFTKDYSKARDLKKGQKDMLRHIQFEARMSISGANADTRVTTSSAEQNEALIFLLKTLVEKGDQSKSVNSSELQTSKLAPQMTKQLQKTAEELLKHKGESLVVSGSNDTDAQFIVIAINETLGNYGKTIEITLPSRQAHTSDGAFAGLIEEMKNGEVGALFLLNVNPAYDCFAPKEFSDR